LTLFGGFASTVFWPLSQFLLDEIGWRWAFAVYTGLHLLVNLPLHLSLVPRMHAARPIAEVPHGDAGVREGDRAVFAWLATALALAAFMGTAIAAHVIDLLTATGLSARDAVLIGSLIGPMQVAGRVMELAFGRHLRALAVGTLAFTLMAAALALFTQVHGLWIVALAFAMVYGWSNGVMTIVRGTVPAELFGQRGYGALLGRLARPQFILKSSAPVALTLLYTIDPARTLTPYVLLLVAVAALIAYRLAIAAAGSRNKSR
jgi:predicted MFS family arabinose efflux permease